MTSTLAPVGTAPQRKPHRNFNLLWLGEGVSVLGNATTSILIPLLAITGFGAGPGWMGTLTAAAWLPWLVIGLPAGAWVDRMDPRRVMITSDLVAAAALVTVPIAALFDVLTLAHLVIAALVNGGATVFFRTAYSKLLIEIVDEDDLEQANGKLFGTESAMQVVGPGVGGVMAQVLSAAGAILLDVFSFLISAFCLFRIRPTPPHEPVAQPPKESLRTRIKDGISYVARDRYLRTMTLIGGASNFGLTGMMALIVLFLIDSIGLRPSLVGLALTLGSVGGLVGAAIARSLSQRWGSGRVSTGLLVLSGPSVMFVPLAGPGWGVTWLILGLFLVGVFVVAGNVIRAAWRQRYVPAALMGRAVTTSQVINFGTMPLAGVTAGILGESIGLRATITVMALIHLLACTAILISPFRSLRELPDQELVSM